MPVRSWLRSRWQDSRQIPDAWTVAGKPKQDPWLGSPLGREPRAVSYCEIAPRDTRSHRTDVAFDQLAHPTHLDSAERSNRFEHDENAPRVTRQVAEFEIAFGDHYLEPSVAPAKPNRRNEGAAVLSIRGQSRRRGSLQERAYAFDHISSHLTSLVGCAGSSSAVKRPLQRAAAAGEDGHERFASIERLLACRSA